MATLSRCQPARCAPGLAALACGIAFALPVSTGTAGAEPAEPPTVRLAARLVAVGLPGVAGVRQVGEIG